MIRIENKIRVYLYTIKDDNTLNVQEGYLDHLWRSQSLFASDNGNRYYVATEAYKIHYRKLWMIDRDDDLARQLYIEYHERRLKEIERTLETHRQAIEVLKGEKKND